MTQKTGVLAALQANATKNLPRVLRGRANMLVRLEGFNDDSLKVTALNGPLKDQTINVKPTNAEVDSFRKESDKQTDQYTKIGGTIRLDQCQADGKGDYKAYATVFIKDPTKGDEPLTDVLIRPVHAQSNGKEIVLVQTMSPSQETKIESLEQLEEAVAAAFASHRNAMLFFNMDGGVVEMQMQLSYTQGEDRKRVYHDPVETARSLFSEGLNEEQKDDLRAKIEAGLSVVPMGVNLLGNDTLKNIRIDEARAAKKGDRPQIRTFNLYAYETASLGQRVHNAIARQGDNALSEEHVERLKTAFLDFTDKTGKETLLSEGWKKVSDTHLKEFFASKGVEVADQPDTGFNNGSLVLRPYSGGNGHFVIKSHENARFANPYPNLKCFAEVRETYLTEIHDAIMTVVGAPKAEVKEQAAEAESKAPAAAKEAPEATPEVSSTVSMLDQIAEDGIDL